MQPPMLLALGHAELSERFPRRCRLGLEDCVDGIDAQRVRGYCMFKGDGEAVVGYPTEGGCRRKGAGTCCPVLRRARSLRLRSLHAPAGLDEDVAGRSFHHGRFVQRLRQAVAALPSVSLRQGTVRRLINGERGRRACACPRSTCPPSTRAGFLTQHLCRLQARAATGRRGRW